MKNSEQKPLLLSQPIKLGELELKNRIVKASMVENLASENGEVQDALIKLYERWAKGGASLLITGGAYVQKNGRSVRYLIGAHDDSLIPGLARLTEAVHKFGAKIVLQIYHCGRQTQPELVDGDVIAPSAVKDQLTKVMPREMTEKEIEEVIISFGKSALRAKQAGFDGVEVMAGHGYLINQFLSRRTNKRKDSWGGSLENRARFLFEIIKEIRRQVGDSYPLLVKLNTEDQLKEGFSVEESAWVAEKLSEMGVNAIKLTGGTFESGLNIARGAIPEDEILEDLAGWEKYRVKMIIRAMKRKFRFYEAYFLKNARRISPRVKVPIILVGGLRTVEVMENILKEGASQLIALGRPLVRDPDFPNKILEGKAKQSTCQNCNRCFIRIAQEKPLRCYALEKEKT